MMSAREYGRGSRDRQGAGNTPFRYPGGKAFLADLLEHRISDVGLSIYAEPFAGGAGAAIELLARGAVETVVLNDFDRRIYAAWQAILGSTDTFIDRIRSTVVDMDTWYRCRRLVEDNAADADPFELGFATYFLNRTNHSGVILGAGPIGGYQQTGKWLINARWYPDTMVKRIAWLGERRKQIRLSNQDGLAFLRTYPGGDAKQTFFFIDPPYVRAGAKLYMNAMSDLKHRDLATFLCAGHFNNWLVTYDDCALVNEGYRNAGASRLPVRYSLRRKRMEEEVLFVPASSRESFPSIPKNPEIQ